MTSTRPRRLALVSPDLEWNPEWEDPMGSELFFSYGAAKLGAAVMTAPDLEDVEVLVLDLQSGDPDEFFEEIVKFKPSIVGGSLYLWSIGPFRDLARRIRKWDPSVRIIVGGPHARRSVFQIPEYQDYKDVIDAAVPWDGEAVLVDIVRRHLDDDWLETPGMLVPTTDGWKDTGTVPRPVIDDYPTPYMVGMAPRGATGYLETFRGCPIHCTFCQWGEARPGAIHSAEYLAKNLQAMREARVHNVSCLDAGFNLNPRALRNFIAAEKEVKFLAESSFVSHMYPTFLKDEQVEFLASFGDLQISIGIQSFNAEMLHELGRPFDFERFERVLKVIQQYCDVTLELILGLPGDNPKSFIEALHKTAELADNVRIFYALVLPDALLERATPEQKVEFDPHTFLMKSCKGWSPEGLAETMEYCRKFALQHYEPVARESWAAFHTRAPENRRELLKHRVERETIRLESDAERNLPPVDIEAVERVRMAVVAQVEGWRLRMVAQAPDGVVFDFDGPVGRIGLEAAPSQPGKESFHDRDGIAYSHTGELDHAYVPSLLKVIDIVHPEAVPMVEERT